MGFFTFQKFPNTLLSCITLCICHKCITAGFFCFLGNCTHYHNISNSLDALYHYPYCDVRTGLGIRSFTHRSFRSNQSSYCERFAQIAQDKWATVSKLLRSLKTNERPWAIRSGCSEEMAKKSKILFFSMFYIRFFYLKNERIAHSLFFGERCEWIAQVAHQKWAMWANRSGRSPKMSEWVNRSFFWANCSFAHFWAKNERFARKTDERIPSPGYTAIKRY